MELILAEKPSAARNFAKALGGKTGNYAGTEYKITNLRGHVMGLLPPDKQVPTEKVEFYKSWDLENLPWNLNDFAWKKGILSGCKDIISGLKDELKEADCVVIATDVDPSGEGRTARLGGFGEMRLERPDQAYVLCRRGAGKRAEGFQGTQDPSIYGQGRRLCEGSRPRALGSREHAVHPCGNTRSAKKGVPNGRTPGPVEIGHGQTDR